MNELKKSIHDNTTGLEYTLVNDHYLTEHDRSSPGRALHRAVGPLT